LTGEKPLFFRALFQSSIRAFSDQIGAYFASLKYAAQSAGVNRPGISGGSNSEVDWSHDEQDNEQI
jgi:hypothetical protein